MDRRLPPPAQADGVLVIDHESEMTAAVGSLRPALLEREKRIAEIDEGRAFAPVAKQLTLPGLAWRKR